MTIKFNRLRLHNFVSFADTAIELAGTYCTLISGRNECIEDNAKSNGSGKSSIFNGLCFALTGETAQGISSGLENTFADPDDCWVELSFTADNTEFTIRRSKTPRQMLYVYVNGEDKSGKGVRESQRVLNEYLPDLDSEMLCNIIILGQGLPHRLSQWNPGGRKDILERLTKSDYMIDTIKSKLDSRQGMLKQMQREAEDEITANDATVASLERRAKSISSDLSAFTSIDDIKTQIINIDSKLKASRNDLEMLSNELESLTAERVALEEKKSAVTCKRMSELSEAKAESDTSLIELQRLDASLEAKLKTIDKEIKKLDAITDICPTCGQKLIGITKPDTTQLKRDRESLVDQKSENIADMRSIEAEKAAKLKDIESKYDNELKSTAKSINENNTRQLTVKCSITALNRETSTDESSLHKLNSLLDTYEKSKIELDSIDAEIKSLNKLSELKLSELDTIKARLGIIQQLITLTKREFRGYILSNVIEYINSRVQYYSSIVFENRGLSFSLNDNKIDIIYNSRLYENLSGGEKQKVDIIIQLALRDLLSKQLNVKSNILVCDEILDNLDAPGASKVIDMLQNRSEVESLFFITHHAEELGISYDRMMTVVKDQNGISTILES